MAETERKAHESAVKGVERRERRPFGRDVVDSVMAAIDIECMVPPRTLMAEATQTDRRSGATRLGATPDRMHTYPAVRSHTLRKC